MSYPRPARGEKQRTQGRRMRGAPSVRPLQGISKNRSGSDHAVQPTMTNEKDADKNKTNQRIFSLIFYSVYNRLLRVYLPLHLNAL